MRRSIPCSAPSAVCRRRIRRHLRRLETGLVVRSEDLALAPGQVFLGGFHPAQKLGTGRRQAHLAQLDTGRRHEYVALQRWELLGA